MLTNDGDQPVHVFEPATRFIAADGRLARDQFEAVNAFGRKAPYRGRWVNWGGTVMAVFRLIQHGEVLEATVDLTNEYDFGTGGPFTLHYVLSMDWTPDPERNTAAEELAAFPPGSQGVIYSNRVTVFTPASQPRTGVRVRVLTEKRDNLTLQSVCDFRRSLSECSCATQSVCYRPQSAYDTSYRSEMYRDIGCLESRIYQA